MLNLIYNENHSHERINPVFSMVAGRWYFGMHVADYKGIFCIFRALRQQIVPAVSM